MAIAAYADPEPQSLQALNLSDAPSPKTWKSISLSTLQNLIGSMPNRLKTVIKINEDTIQSILIVNEHGQRHRLTLTVIGPLLCNFNGGVI